ncbi:MAG: transporter, partial [Bdellovibrionia bacterium]
MRKNPDLFQNLQVFKLVQPPYGLKHLAHLLCSIFVIFVLMLCLVPWQQTTQGTGRVLAYSPNERPQNIDAPVEGRLGHWFVQEGSHV